MNLKSKIQRLLMQCTSDSNVDDPFDSEQILASLELQGVYYPIYSFEGCAL